MISVLPLRNRTNSEMSAAVTSDILSNSSLERPLAGAKRVASRLLSAVRLGLAVLGILAVPAVSAQTTVTGAIAVDSHWTTAGQPYVVTGDVVVQNAAVLSIDPGVVVAMARNASLTVESGGIQALGVAANPIRVISEVARQGQAAAPGDWKQWTFNPGTKNTRLEHVSFEHGSGLVVKGSAPVMNYVAVLNHLGAAISVDLSASPSGVGNSASGNTVNGIAVPAGDISGSVRWGLRGIPYVVASGVVSVGASPTIASVTPNTLQQGETVTMTVNGSRLAGLSGVRFGTPGLSAQILPGATDQQATLSVTAEPGAAVGSVDLNLTVDAGKARKQSALTLAQAQPVLTALTPSSLYLGQGAVDVGIGGRSLSNQSVVMVNGTAVATQFVSATQLRATIAIPSAVGNLSVRVRTPNPSAVGQYFDSNELLLPVVAAQITLSPSTVTAVKGGGKTFNVSLPYAAPQDGVVINLVSSVPTVAAVPATVTIAGGASSATFQLSATDLGSTTITASKVGAVSGQAQVTVVPPPTLTLSPTTLTIGTGRTAQVTVQSSTPAGPSGLIVTLSSSNATVATAESSVTIPAGATTAKFAVNTLSVGSATITAQATDFANGSMAVTVRPTSLNLPAGALVAPGLSRSIPITLSDPAPAGGLVINLSSSNAAVASVPASITVPEGQSNANFTLTGNAAGTATIAATATGYQSGGLPVTVETVTIGIGSPAVNSISVPAELGQSFAVTLSRPAPAGGVTISLTTADTSKASVTPATITIAEGQTSGGLTVATVNGVAVGTTTLVATAAGLNAANVPVTVTNKAQFAFSTNSLTVGKGLKTYFYEVYVRRTTDGNNFAPNYAQEVRLVSADAAKASVPASVTIPAGQYYAYFYVTGVDLTNGTPVTVDAVATGYSSPATKLAVNVVAPVLNFQSLDSKRSPASARDDFSFWVSVPGVGNQQTAAADMPIDLSIVEGTPTGIVDGFYNTLTGGPAVTQVVLKAGSGSTGAVYVGTPTGQGSYKVQASAAGVASATSGAVTVSSPELRFSASSVTVGKGLKNYIYEIYVYRAVGGNAFNGTDALTVNLSSSDAAKANVPASVTIPAGQYYAYFYVTGVDLTNGTPVTVDAVATGYSAPATKLAVNVVAPVFNFQSLDSKRSPASARDDFNLWVTVPGAVYSGNQTAVADMPIDLSVVEGTPAGIVGGFYNALTGGAAVTQVLLRKDSNTSDTAYVGTPTGAGSYKVQASAAGVASATSGAVTVSPPELRFSASSVTVGKGLKNYVYEIYVYRAVGGNAFNGTDALTVNLSSSDAAKANVPASVTIPAGQYYAYFYVTGVDLTNGTPVTVDAVATGYSAPATKLAVNVVAPVFNFQSLDSKRSPASARDDFSFWVSVPGAWNQQTAAADMPIDLSIVEETPTGIVDGFYNALTGGPAVTQVVLKAGSGSTGAVYVGTPTGAGSYKVQASAAGVASATSGAVTVSPPELRFSASSVIVGKGLKTHIYEVYVYRAANGAAFNGTDALTVSLTCSSTAICAVPSTVTIPAGQSSAYFTVEGVGLGTTTIVANAVGYSATQDLAVSVVSPQLNFSGPPNTAVGAQNNFSVYLTTPGASYNNNPMAVAPITVNLTSSAPGVATVPTTVTIPAGSVYSATTKLTGVAAGTTTVTASGAGLSSATSGVITVTP